MNVNRIMSAARTIAECEEALSWLYEYGHRLSDKDENVSVQIRVNFAGACRGAKEAESILSSKALSNIQSIVASAVEDRRNTIEICRKTILDALTEGN